MMYPSDSPSTSRRAWTLEIESGACWVARDPKWSTRSSWTEIRIWATCALPVLIPKRRAWIFRTWETWMWAEMQRSYSPACLRSRGRHRVGVSSLSAEDWGRTSCTVRTSGNAQRSLVCHLQGKNVDLCKLRVFWVLSRNSRPANDDPPAPRSAVVRRLNPCSPRWSRDGVGGIPFTRLG